MPFLIGIASAVGSAITAGQAAGIGAAIGAATVAGSKLFAQDEGEGTVVPDYDDDLEDIVELLEQRRIRRMKKKV